MKCRARSLLPGVNVGVLTIFNRIVTMLTDRNVQIPFTKAGIMQEYNGPLKWKKDVYPAFVQALSKEECPIVLSDDEKLYHIRWKVAEFIKNECRLKKIVNIKNCILETPEFKNRITLSGVRNVLESEKEVSVFVNEYKGDHMYFACPKNTIPAQTADDMERFFKMNVGRGIPVNNISTLYENSLRDMKKIKGIHIVNQNLTCQKIAVYAQLPVERNAEFVKCLRDIKTSPAPIDIDRVAWATSRVEAQTTQLKRRIKRRRRRPKNPKKKK